MHEEIWKDIKGYEGLYQISSYGRILGLERYNSEGKRIRKERMLTGSQEKKAPTWIKFNLHDGNGVAKSVNLIQLMISHFGVEDPLSKIIFKDGNILNRRLSNIGFLSRDTDNQSDEIWKPMVGFEEHYEISNYGRVWRLPNTDNNGHLHRAMFIELPILNGRVIFQSSKFILGRSITVAVWKVLCKTFLNKEPKGVLYKDNDLTNLHLDNLILVQQQTRPSLHKNKKTASFNISKRSLTIKTNVSYVMEMPNDPVGIFFPKNSILIRELRIKKSTLNSSFRRRSKQDEYRHVSYIQGYQITRMKSTGS